MFVLFSIMSHSRIAARAPGERGPYTPMRHRPAKRDYSLLGESAKRAVAKGLMAAEWYHTDIPRKQMKELMKRSDGPATRDTALWLGGMALLGSLGVAFWESWWAMPFFAAYGVLYGSASDSRWHECGHGTAFRTRWMNDAVYQIACFMIMRNPVAWRWSHTRHHTDTIIVGADPEIVLMRPPALARVALNMFGILDVAVAMKHMAMNTFGILDAEQKTFIPEMEQRRVFTVARVWFAVYAATIGAAVAMGSILPLMLIGLPRMYGAWHHVLCGLMQHGGLAEDVLDHRLNSRTVYLNPVSRFIYWNMNYHVEHHMFPMVPYHALPRLHEMIKHDLPAANDGFLDAYREMMPAVIRQLRYQDWFIKRALPPTAKPYRPEFHGQVEPVMVAAE
jgi:fatty acid desaturase